MCMSCGKACAVIGATVWRLGHENCNMFVLLFRGRRRCRLITLFYYYCYYITHDIKAYYVIPSLDTTIRLFCVNFANRSFNMIRCLLGENGATGTRSQPLISLQHVTYVSCIIVIHIHKANVSDALQCADILDTTYSQTTVGTHLPRFKPHVYNT